MTGAFLIGFAVIAVISFLIWNFGDTYEEEVWGVITVVAVILVVSLLVAIPCNRISTKQNAAMAEIFQKNLNQNREQDGMFSVMERTEVFDKIIDYNSHINSWQIKGQKWYNNKWYLHPDTQTAKLIDYPEN